MPMTTKLTLEPHKTRKEYEAKVLDFLQKNPDALKNPDGLDATGFTVSIEQKEKRGQWGPLITRNTFDASHIGNPHRIAEKVALVVESFQQYNVDKAGADIFVEFTFLT